MKYFIYSIVFIIGLVSKAQNCNFIFRGEIIDFHDNSPLEGATIFIENIDRYVTSDKQGKFKIENLCKGILTLTISHVGCENKKLNINIDSDTTKQIFLEHHIEELDEIGVNASVVKKETKTAQEQILKVETIERYSSFSLGDALREISGVSSINTGNTIVKPMINGLHSSRVLILNNGVRLQDQEWGIEHAPNIDINSANQISVIKGSGALAYGGDAIGGVVILKPKRAVMKDTLFGKTILGGQSNGKGYFINSSLNKNYASGWFGQIQATYKRNGDYQAPDYNLTNTGLESKGVSVQLGKKTFESGFEVFYSFIDNEIGILRAAHTGNGGDLADAINAVHPSFIRDFSYDINPPKQVIQHHLFKATYYKRIQNFGKVDVQYDYQNNQRFEFDIRRGERRDIPAVDLVLQTHTLLANAKLDSNLNRIIKFGILARYQNNFADPDTGVRRLIPDYDKYDFGTYLNSEWRVNDKLFLDAGLRYDFSRIDAQKFYQLSRWVERGYDTQFADLVVPNEDAESVGQIFTNPVFDYHNFSGAFGSKFQLKDHSSILLNYALSTRAPNPSELFSDGLHHAAARFEFGDLRLNQEVSNRIGISYNYKDDKLNFLVDTYYNFINDYIYLRPSGESEITNRGEFVAWEYVQSRAEIFGVDLSLSYNISDQINFTNKSSFIKGYDKTDAIPLIDIPSFYTTNSITFEKKEWKNFRANLTSEWVIEQNEFPDFNFSVFDAVQNQDVFVDISTPPPAYHLLHFSSKVNFNIKNNTSLNLSLTINNIFNTNYRNYLNRLRFFADEVGRNFSIQLKLNY